MDTDTEFDKDHGKTQTEPVQDAIESGTFEALGYTQIYTRVLRGFGQVCLVIALTAPLGAQMVVAFYQITYGGYFGLIWGWFVPSALIFCQVLAYAELCSAMPVNGSTYWWIAALAPPKWSRPMSFISGCTIVLSLFTGVSSFAFAISSALCRIIYLVQPSFIPTPAVEMGIAMGVVILWAFLVLVRLDRASWIFIICTGILLAQILVWVIALPATHSKLDKQFAPAARVFGSFQNYSDYGNGVAVPFTFFAATWVNSAWQAPSYMVEGTHNARREVPRAMITSYLVTAGVGMIICIVAAFCITDIKAAGLDPTYFPFFTLLVEHWGTAGTFGFVMPGLVAGLFGGSGFLLANACQLAAFARDGGLPYGDRLTFVHPRTNTPVYASTLLCLGSILILLLALSPVASSTIYTLATMVSLITGSIPIGLRIIAPAERYAPGPYNLGRYSLPVFTVAFLTLWYLIIMEAFPASKAWTGATFNYNWVVTLAAMLVSVLLYLFYGSTYVGPDLEALARFRHDNSRHHSH